MNEDPFERAVARESALHQRSRPELGKIWRLVLGFRLILITSWGGLVALHFALWPDPGWLRITHLILFVLTCSYWMVGMALVRVFMRWIPKPYESTEPPGYRDRTR